MTLSQFNCPHCQSPFQVDSSLSSLQVACPHCRQPVAVFSESPVVAPSTVAPPLTEPPLATPSPAELPISEPRDYAPSDLLPPKSVVPTEPAAPQQVENPPPTTDDYVSRQLAADDRASRKFIKNMIVWVGCAIVLITILAFFLMQGGAD